MSPLSRISGLFGIVIRELTTMISAPFSALRRGVVRRMGRSAPQFQIVSSRAIRLFEYTARQSRDGMDARKGFWNKAEYLKDQILAVTMAPQRGNMSRQYRDYTAAMLRSEMATYDVETGIVFEVDDSIEAVCRWHAHCACTASL